MVFSLKDPLDLVDRWSVLGRLKYLTQYSYWPKGWGKLTVRALYLRGAGGGAANFSDLSVRAWFCC